MSGHYSLLVALAAALTVAFLVSGRSRARPRFAYGECSTRTTTETRPDGCYLLHESTGVVKNRSTEANSLESLHLACWWPDRRGAAVFTNSAVTITEAGVDTTLPLRFEEKSSRLLVLHWEIRISEPAEVAQHRRYEVALQDSDDRLFDQHGRLKNRRNIERLQRFSDSVRDFSGDEMPSFATTALKLKANETMFRVQWLLWRLGF